MPMPHGLELISIRVFAAEAFVDRLRTVIVSAGIGRTGQMSTVSMSGLLDVGAPPVENTSCGS